jgi:hypothetical protein
LSYAAVYRGRSESVSADRLLRREGHPLGVKRYYEDPAEDEAQAAGVHKKWTFGVAAGALLVAGTFAAGALGLNGSSLPLAGENAPEHAPAAAGHGPSGSQGPGDIGTPAVAAPPHGGHNQGAGGNGNHGNAGGDATHGTAAYGGAQSGTGGASRSGGTGASGGHAVPAQPAAPATPAPAPSPAPAPRQPGPVEKVVKPVTDTVGDVTRPVTDTVGHVLSPVTGVLSGGGDQPALTMIDPLGDLLGQ